RARRPRGPFAFEQAGVAPWLRCFKITKRQGPTLNHNGPKSFAPLPWERSAAPAASASSSAPRAETLRPPPPDPAATYGPPAQLPKRRATVEFPPAGFARPAAPQPFATYPAPQPSVPSPLDRSFATTSRRPAPWPSSIAPVAMPSAPPSTHDP